MRIVFFGDSVWGAAGLGGLLRDGHTIPLVVLRRRPSDDAMQQAAANAAIPTAQPANVNAPEFVERIRELAPDLNVSMSYEQILQPAILEAAPQGFINGHAGRLPHYRGRNVINWAIINDEREIGLTVHYIDAGIDTGDIILQRTVAIEWTDDYATVLEKIYSTLPDLLVEAVRQIADGTAARTVQAALPGSYFSRRVPGDEWLDWSQSSRVLYNKIRAITRPGPGARTVLGSRELVIWRADYDPQWPAYLATPGEVVGREAEGVMVKTGDSTLRISSIQFADEAEPIRPTWRIGTRLGVDFLQTIRALQIRVQQLETQLDERRTTTP